MAKSYDFQSYITEHNTRRNEWDGLGIGALISPKFTDLLNC